LAESLEGKVISYNAKDGSKKELKIGKPLPGGSFGEVYLASDDSGVEQVVKFLATAHCDNPNLVDKFSNEIARMSEFDHPNIVEYYGEGSVQTAGLDRPFYVMEKWGESLSKKLGEGKFLRPEELVEIIKQVCNGLKHAYGKDVKAHRDLHPGNILIKENRVKIADFGMMLENPLLLASNVSMKTMAQSLEHTTNIFNEFAAPELRDKRLEDAANQKTDIFSLGVVMKKYFGRIPQPYASPYIDKQLHEIFHKAADEFPAYRHSNIDSFISALTSVRESQTLPALQVSPEVAKQFETTPPVQPSQAPPQPVKDRYDEGFNNGFAKGDKEGYDRGHTKGREHGYSEGSCEGEQVGYHNGEEEGKKVGHAAGLEEGKAIANENEYDNGYYSGEEEGKKKGFEEGRNAGYDEGCREGEKAAKKALRKGKWTIGKALGLAIPATALVAAGLGVLGTLFGDKIIAPFRSGTGDYDSHGAVAAEVSESEQVTRRSGTDDYDSHGAVATEVSESEQVTRISCRNGEIVMHTNEGYSTYRSSYPNFLEVYYWNNKPAGGLIVDIDECMLPGQNNPSDIEKDILRGRIRSRDPSSLNDDEIDPSERITNIVCNQNTAKPVISRTRMNMFDIDNPRLHQTTPMYDNEPGEGYLVIDPDEYCLHPDEESNK
jgi:serine/threonine protein kinase